MQFHPLANIFPLLENGEFAALRADIAEHGQREPIWLTAGAEPLILDGRNRYRACKELGIECDARVYEGDDPAAFVVSLNLHRRHLSESQRAMVGAKLANLENGQKASSANLQSTAVSQSKAAELVNVSTRSVASAAKVEAEGVPELVRAVETGAMSVSLGARVAELPKEEQAPVAALKDSPAEMREAAKVAVHNHRAQGTGENEWYTPAEHIEAAREFMGGIDLDPASSEIAQQVVRADAFFTVDDDGLSKEWRGKVWLNPPYAQPAISHFVEKMVASADSVDEAIMLTHNYTDTQWFHRAASKASAICFTRGRIGFLSPEGKRAAPTQGQAFFYYGRRPQRFAEHFSKFGLVLKA